MDINCNECGSRITDLGYCVLCLPDEDKGSPIAEVVVAGRKLCGPLNQFIYRCQFFIQEEQDKIAPNNALIDVLCNGVRLAREYSDKS